MEDSPTQALLTRRDLESHGFHVITVDNGRKALDAAADDPPDVILSDVLMPEFDGFRLCLHARMDRRLRSIPIVLRSSQFVASEDRGLARAAGADAFIQKDVSAQELVDLLKATISAARDERVFFDPETFRSEYGARLLAKAIRDATELERVNERLVENQARLQGLLDNAPIVIAVNDVEGRFVVANPQLQRLVDKPHGEIIGKTFEDLFPVEVAGRLHDSGERVFATGSPLHSEENLLRERAEHSFEVIRFLLTDPDDRVQGLCTIANNVTVRRRLERELRDLQKMETVGLLAGGVAHDFGNFLSVISTYASFLQEELEPSDPRGDDVAEIQKAAESARGLARQLMTLSRHESIVPEIVDLNEIISDMTQLLSIATGDMVTLEINLGSALPPIKIIPGHVEQVLMNLAVNARDAMPSGGSLLIETSTEEVNAQSGTAPASPGATVRLRVQDTGEGMSKETIERIFDPFFTTKSRKKGTGLGLATVQKVIESAGGTISVQSGPGRGTSFDLLLPAAVAPEERSTTPDATGPIRVQGQTILIVDDEEAVRAVLERALSEFGFKLLVAATVDEARQFIRRNDEGIDLIVCDVFLPDGSGRHLVDDLKERDPSVEVIFISGWFEAAFPEGVDYGALCLAKPFRSDELCERVKGLLDARSP